MSLNPVSYLQTWEHNLAAAHRRYRGLYADNTSVDDNDEDEEYHDLPDSSSSSASFLSRFSHDSLGRRLNFYPYAGAGVTPSGTASQEATERLNGQPCLYDLEKIQKCRTVAAFDVSRRKRLVQVCAAMLSCFLSVGLIFGFAAVKPVLLQEGVYQCTTEESPNGICFEQELRLDLIFAVASAVFYISTFPVGTALATYGPRIGGVVGSLFVAGGALLLAFATSLPFDAYILGFLSLGLGGTFVYISSLHLVNAFPTRSMLILSAFTGALDSSPAVFAIFRAINESTDHLSLQTFFLLYLVVPTFVFVMQLLIMPEALYMTPAELILLADTCSAGPSSVVGYASLRHRALESVTREAQVLLGDNSEGFSKTRQAIRSSSDALTGWTSYIHPLRLLRGVRGSPCLQLQPLLLMALFITTQVLHLNYFITSVNWQYETTVSHDQNHHFTKTFHVLLPLGGIISSLYTRPLFQRTRASLVLALLVVFSAISGIIGCIPSLATGYIHLLVYALYRPFFFVAVLEYIAKICGQSSGFTYGLLAFIAGLGNFAIPALDVLSFKAGFIPVNAGLTVVSTSAGAALVWLLWSVCDSSGDTIDEPGTAERRQLVPPAGEDVVVDMEQEPLLYEHAHISDRGGPYGGARAI